MKACFTIVFPMIVMAVPLQALGQSLTEEEIAGVMESQAVEGDFQACAQGQAAGTVPQALELVLKIEPDGNVQLSHTSPKTEGPFFTCLVMVAKRIKFRATGMAVEVIYPMDFPVQTGTSAPGPGPTTGQNVVVLPKETPQPAPAAGTAPAGGKPGMFTDPQWEAEYYRGRNMVIAGAVLLPISALTFLSSGLCWLITGIICLVGDDEEAKQCTMARISAIVGGVSLVVMITSIVILAVGSGKKRRARYYMTAGGLMFDVGFIPLTGGGGGALAWRF
jgi:hypothetical protein